MEDPHDYSTYLTDLWCEGETFILLEHDVVPWPGALTAIADCRDPWCAYPYPFAPGCIRHALGCVKFSGALLAEFPDLPISWQGKTWNQLDGAVYGALKRLQRTPHLHLPPLAHVK